VAKISDTILRIFEKNYMKNVFYLILLLLTGILNQGIFAQDQPDVRDRANRLYKEFQYSRAAGIYLDLTDVDRPYLQDMENLANCYARMNQYEDAEIWYARVVQHRKSNPENLIKYGRILKANAKYSKAREIFQQYIKKTGKPLPVINDIAGCDSAMIWMSKLSNFTVRNQAAINTQRAEFYVWPMKEEKSVYFMGEPADNKRENKYGWTGNSYLRIFKASKISNDSLAKPALANLDVNNSVYHIGPVISNKANDIMFITHTYSGKESKMSKIDGRTYFDHSMELYIQTKVYGLFKDPVPFVHNNVKKYSVGHAALSVDEKTLYFVSDMPGGFGGTDIWFCTLQKNGTWGKFANAGKAINSPGNEFFPFIAEDGSLYFSSDGWPGMGGLDVFMATGDKNKWSKPVNLKYPLNSPGDDFALFTDNNLQNGFISSNRINGKGNDDIYSFKFEKSRKLSVLNGKTIDKKSLKELSGASVILYDLNNNIIAQQQSGPDGAFSFEINKTLAYKLQGSKFSYFPDTLAIMPQASDSVTAILNLDPLFVKGKVFRLKNILYDFDKADIRPDAALILNELVQIMHENPTLKIELGSHTDSRGTNEYNQDLSQRRAQSAVDYLVSKGIARLRMIAKGYGESRLINRCADGVECTEEEHQANRRTEFTVLEY
jgi:outer membrane protein OmpA-like peptidoglycan-associated protein